MRKQFLALLIGALVVVLSVGAGASVAGGGATAATEPTTRSSDSLSSPLAEKQDALRAVGLQKLASGQIPAGHEGRAGREGPVRPARPRGRGLDLDGAGRVRQRDVRRHRPLHNQIPQPDRSVDNTTIWTADFSQPYYEDLLFDDAAGPELDAELLQGAVLEPVHRERRRDQLGAGAQQRGVLRQQRVRLRSSARIPGSSSTTRSTRGPRTMSSQRRRQRVPGAVRRLGPLRLRRRRQLQRAGRLHRPLPVDPRRRWARKSAAARRARTRSGRTAGTRTTPALRPGPTAPGPHGFQGVRIGTTNYWIGDYTIEPENGGVGVFSHEFGARPRPAGRVRHVGQHWRRRELDRPGGRLMSQGSYGTQTDDLGSSADAT